MTLSLAIWGPIVAACVAISICALNRSFRVNNAPLVLRFVALAMFLRLTSSAVHQLTFDPLLGPLSINAMLSLGTLAVGFLIIDRRILLFKFFWVIYIIIGLVFISAIINGTIGQSFATLTKWLLLLVLIAGLLQAFLKTSRANVTSVLLTVFLLPVLLQFIALLMGNVKATEYDGSISYVGGYHHEAGFSIILTIAFFLSLLRAKDQKTVTIMWGLGLPILLFGFVIMTNYRTTILAVSVPFAYFLLKGVIDVRTAYMQFILAPVGMCLVILVGYFGADAFTERFYDLRLVLANSEALIQRPEYYTEWQRDYLSSRAFIWSQYLTAWVDASSLNQWLGMGADSWEGKFPKYAHNTFVSFLYELGVLGVLGLSAFFVSILIGARRMPILALMVVSFAVLNLGTMPLWQVEGVFLASILTALSFYQKIVSTRCESTPEGLSCASRS